MSFLEITKSKLEIIILLLRFGAANGYGWSEGWGDLMHHVDNSRILLLYYP